MSMYTIHRSDQSRAVHHDSLESDSRLFSSEVSQLPLITNNVVQSQCQQAKAPRRKGKHQTSWLYRATYERLTLLSAALAGRQSCRKGRVGRFVVKGRIQDYFKCWNSFDQCVGQHFD